MQVSVVVPAYQADATLHACVASLLRQNFRGSFEVVVCASADTVHGLPQLGTDPRLRLITHVPRLGAAAARNRAAAQARGEGIAFTDADVVVREDWLQRLVDASGGRRCVAGAVRNGTPHSLIGSAEYLMQFIDLHPNRRPRSVHFGATCNLFLPRVLWVSMGPFPEDMDGGEDTLMTARLIKEDLFVFEREALVFHLNRTRFNDFLRHQYAFGCFSARLARRGPGLGGSTLRQTLQTHAALAPVAAVAKICWIYFRAVTLGRTLALTALRCFPLILLGVGAWGVGLFVESIRQSGGERSET